jgi:hypothetical protein
MSGGCVGEAIELGASGSRTGRAVISRSNRFRQSISEFRLSFFERAWVFVLSTRRVSMLSLLAKNVPFPRCSSIVGEHTVICRRWGSRSIRHGDIRSHAFHRKGELLQRGLTMEVGRGGVENAPVSEMLTQRASTGQNTI